MLSTFLFTVMIVVIINDSRPGRPGAPGNGLRNYRPPYFSESGGPTEPPREHVREIGEFWGAYRPREVISD